MCRISNAGPPRQPTYMNSRLLAGFSSQSSYQDELLFTSPSAIIIQVRSPNGGRWLTAFSSEFEKRWRKPIPRKLGQIQQLTFFFTRVFFSLQWRRGGNRSIWCKVSFFSRAFLCQNIFWKSILWITTEWAWFRWPPFLSSFPFHTGY